MYSKEQLNLLHRLLVNRSDVYYAQQWGTSKYLTVYKPVTIRLLTENLADSKTLGLPVLALDSTCKYVTWDEDTGYEQNLYTDKIQAALKQLGYHPLREGKRHDRGGHVNLYLDAPTPAADCRLFAAEIEKLCGIPESAHQLKERKPAALEFFPKQPKLESGGIGNCIKMPWSINRKHDANKCRALFEDCTSTDISEQVTWFLQQSLNPSKRIVEIADMVRKRTTDNKPQARRSTYRGKLPAATEVARILKLKKRGNGWWHGNCPCHDGAHASFGCADGDYTLLVSCQAGCSRDSLIVEILRLTPPAAGALLDSWFPPAFAHIGVLHT